MFSWQRVQHQTSQMFSFICYFETRDGSRKGEEFKCVWMEALEHVGVGVQMYLRCPWGHIDNSTMAPALSTSVSSRSSFPFLSHLDTHPKSYEWRHRGYWVDTGRHWLWLGPERVHKLRRRDPESSLTD